MSESRVQDVEESELFKKLYGAGDADALTAKERVSFLAL